MLHPREVLAFTHANAVVTLLAVVVSILVVLVLLGFVSLFRHALLVGLILASGLAGLLTAGATSSATVGFGVSAALFLCGVVIHTIMDTARLLALGRRDADPHRRATRAPHTPARSASRRKAA